MTNEEVNGIHPVLFRFGVEEQTSLTITYVVNDTARPRRNNWQTRRHRFKDHITKCFICRRKGE